MRCAVFLVLAGLCVPAWTVTPASAKISAMSGAYDGRGASPETTKTETAKPQTVKPKAKKTRKPVKSPTNGTGGN